MVGLMDEKIIFDYDIKYNRQNIRVTFKLPNLKATDNYLIENDIIEKLSIKSTREISTKFTKILS